MTGVQIEKAGSQQEPQKQDILQHPGLDNGSNELEMGKMTDGWNCSLINHDTPSCVMNMSSNFSIQCPADPDLQVHLRVYTAAGVVSLLSLLIIFIVYWYVPDSRLFMER